MSYAVLFDLDGTLVDSAPDLTAALNVVLAARGRSPLPEETVRTLIGGGARRLLDRAMALTGEPVQDDLFPPFRHAYRARIATKSRVYPGITAVLAGVRKRGHKVAVCTNKPEDMARELVERMGLDLLVQDLIGAGHLPRKPDPAPVVALMERLGVTDAVLVGDSEADVGAARAAGIPSIGVTWGYGDVTGADHIVQDPDALDEVLSRA